MEIIIYRRLKNALYTEGKLLINGGRQTYTVEPTDVMLPKGEYLIQIVKHSARKQTIDIFAIGQASKGQMGKALIQPTGWHLGIAHSFIGSKQHKTIAIGTPLIPGVVYKASRIFERITDRLAKCMERNEPIHLIINDDSCRDHRLSSYWLEPKTHGCPSSDRRLEVDTEGVATIYEGNQYVKTIVPKQS